MTRRLCLESMKPFALKTLRAAMCAAACAALAGLSAPVALAQAGIYTCVDAQGRKLTSDRPIAACTDRDQKELTSSGTVKRVVKPVPTADEAARIEAQKKKEEEEQTRLNEQKRRDRAMLARYPNRTAHDEERTESLAQVDAVMAAAKRRIDELFAQRKKIDVELEFYKADPTKIPQGLRRQIDENTEAIDVQRRFIRGQEEEKKRINQRFNEELARLNVLWGQAAPAAAGAGATTTR